VIDGNRFFWPVGGAALDTIAAQVSVLRILTHE
jgi:hypothetical protein